MNTSPSNLNLDPKKRVEVAIAIVFNAARDRVLICRRKADTVLAGYWEFPGGKHHAGESLAQCAVREVMEELGVSVEALGRLAVIEHDYPYAFVRLHPFVCRHVSGEPQLLAVAEARWVSPAALREYRFPPANAALLEQIAEGSYQILPNENAGSME